MGNQMKPIVVILANIVLFASCFNNNHNYWNEGNGFKLSVYCIGKPSCPSGSFDARVVSKINDPYFNEAYKLFVPDSLDTIEIKVTDMVDSLNLSIDSLYRIIYHQYDWTYEALIIKRNGYLLFEGVDGSLIDDTRPFLDSSDIGFKICRILRDNYKKDNGCCDKIVNAEMLFYSGTDSVVLHQGQISETNNYKVNLPTAYQKEDCSSCVPDTKTSALSFTIHRK
jgi:hypothetical protein